MLYQSLRINHWKVILMAITSFEVLEKMLPSALRLPFRLVLSRKSKQEKVEILLLVNEIKSRLEKGDDTVIQEMIDKYNIPEPVAKQIIGYWNDYQLSNQNK